MAMLRPAEEMKDSGTRYLTMVPVDWSVRKLKRHLRREEPRNPGDVPVLSLYREFGIVLKDSRDDNHNVTSENTSNYKYVQVGDFVVNKMKAWQGSVAVSEYEGIVSPAYYVYHFTDRAFIKRYFHYLLRGAYKDEFMSLSGGIRTGQWDLPSNALDNIMVLVPSIEEQQAIADYLDDRCSKIDEIIAEAEDSIEEYKELKQAVIFETVTKGLDKNVPMKDSGVEWIGEIPNDWRVMPIKYLKADIPNSFVDGPFGSNLKSEHYIDNGDVYVIESGFISTGKFVYKPFKTISYNHFCSIKRSECKGGDIIIAKIGANYGMCAELPSLDKPSVVSGNSLKITIDETKISKYLFVREMELAKKNGAFQDIVGSTAQPALSLGGLNNFRLVVPPIEKQDLITDFLKEKYTKIDALISEKQALIDDLQAYKKSLIYEVVTGKRRVV